MQVSHLGMIDQFRCSKIRNSNKNTRLFEEPIHGFHVCQGLSSNGSSHAGMRGWPIAEALHMGVSRWWLLCVGD